MDWSPQQDSALKDVKDWIENPDKSRQIYRLFGYAGTGKTTLARHLAEGVGGSVLFAAFTGKAASVMRANGCPNAQTLHSLIYHPKEASRELLNQLKKELNALVGDLTEEQESEAELIKLQIREEEKNLSSSVGWVLNSESELRGAALLVVDECSMVNEYMAKDILSFGVPVLVLGDPAQLPPVKGTGYFTDSKPDSMLTEIHRQARDNPIIEMATRVRNGEELCNGSYGDSRIISKATPELALEADQILVGKNRTRIATNRRMRELKGFTGSDWPLEGEKLVCLRNDREFGLLNGTLHECVANSDEIGGFVNLRIRPEEGGDSILVPAHPEHFNGDPDSIDRWERRRAQEFTFGYALTVHKAQGSQWGKVLLIDEWFMADTRQRWLYTAITRAQDSIVVIGGES